MLPFYVWHRLAKKAFYLTSNIKERIQEWSLGNIISCSNSSFLMILKLPITKSDAPILITCLFKEKKAYLFKRESQVLPLKDPVILEYLRYFNIVIAPYAFAVVVVFVVVVLFTVYVYYFAPSRNLLNKNNICVILAF